MPGLLVSHLLRPGEAGEERDGPGDREVQAEALPADRREPEEPDHDDQPLGGAILV